MEVDAEGRVSAAIGDEAQQEVQPPLHKNPTMAVIENIATKGYIDSGSDISLIGEDFRMSLPSLTTKAMLHSLPKGSDW